MSYILWCPKHKMVVGASEYRTALPSGLSHRTAKNCFADFEVREVEP